MVGFTQVAASAAADGTIVNPVSPFVRLVPCGVEYADDGVVLKLTAMVSPKPYEECDAEKGKIGLKDWAGTMLSELLRRNWELPIQLQRMGLAIGTGNCRTMQPVGEVATMVAGIDRLKDVYEDPNNRSNAACLWRTTFGGDNDAKWAALNTLLKSSCSSGGIRASGKMTGGQMRAEAPKLTAAGNVELPADVNQGWQVDGIYTDSHSELAVLLEYDRANRILAQLDQNATANSSNPVAAQQGEKSHGPAVQPAASGGPRNPVDSTETDAQFNEKIVKARQARFNMFYNGLKANFDRGYTAFSNCQKSDAETDPAKCVCPDNGINLLSDAQRALIPSKGRSPQVQEKLDAGVNAHGYLNTPQSVAPEMPSSSNADTALREQVGQDFFAVQTNAVLARLYCLAFDLTVNLADPRNEAVLRMLLPDSEVSPSDASSRAALRIWMKPQGPAQTSEDLPGLGGTDSPATLTTLATALMAGKRPEEPGFWAATREEMIHYLTGSDQPVENFVSQIDGYQLAGREGAYRFEMTSLDVRAAVEHEYMKRLSMPLPAAAAPPTGAASDGDQPSTAADASPVPATNANGHANVPGPTPGGADAAFRTDGLVILDRALQIEKARALARREKMITDKAPNARQMLHAEDLTTGYRLDVAIPGQNGPIWTPLNMRIVNYGIDDRNVPMNPIVHNLLKLGVSGPLNLANRVNMDSSIITAPERMIPAQVNGNSTPQVDLAVTENLVTWQGQPLGVDATRLPLALRDRLDDGAEGTSLSGLAFTRRLFLPLRDHRWSRELDDPLQGLPEHKELEQYQPPRLRYGWPYCFALRVVYSGGRSVPLAQIPKTSTRRMGRAVFPPPGETTPRYFRFLRQRGIGAPVVLLPAAEAVSGTNNQMGVGENEFVILRSVASAGAGEDIRSVADRAQPDTATRIIVPPRIDLDEATLHGAFDAAPAKVPGGAFTWLDLREADGAGYFPVAERQVIRGMNGALLPFKGWTSGEPRLVAPSQPDAAAAKVMLDGRITDVATVFSGPIYKVSRQGGAGDRAYYPDPFAHTLVLRIRHAGRTDGPEVIRQVQIYPNTISENVTDLTKARPVSISFRKSKDQKLNVRCSDCRGASGNGITDLLALPQLPAVLGLTNVDGDPQIQIDLPAGNSFDLDLWYVPTEKDLQGKAAVVQAMAVIEARNGADASDNKTEKPFVAPGGVEVPAFERVKEMAKRLRLALLRAPIAGVTSVTTLRCVHATNDARGSIVVNPQNGATLLFHRASSSEYDSLVSDGGNEARKAPYIIPDSANSILDGDIALDLNRISGFDILARSVDPSTETLDDIARARDLGARRDGTWPTLRDWGGRSYLKNARQIFGFDLAQDGTIAVPKVDFVLYRIRNLPTGLDISDALRAPATAEGLTIIRLFKLLALADRGPEIATQARREPIRVMRVQHFAGTLGRQVELMFRPVPRTLAELGKPDRYEGGSHILREDFPPSLVLGATERGSYPLPCSSRPAIPVVQGITYVFHWKGAGTPSDPRIRETRIRIYLDRGWFSKSDTERLGLILWPPDQDQQVHISKDLVTNQRLPDPQSGPEYGKDRFINRIILPGSWTGAAREFQYLDYNDDDLGPNGRYVTRMGTDPIKEAAFSARAFIGKDDFRLFGATFGAGGGAGKSVDQVTLPAPEAGESTGELDVSLLAVMPKFHAEHEKWYVDIAFPREFATVEPFIRFGIVRYVEDAPAKLQVSSPVAVWAKVMPSRTLVATLSREGMLTVKLSGAALALPVLPGDEGSQNGAPAVYALLMAERVVNGQVVARRELLPGHVPVALRGRPVRPARTHAWLHLEPSGDHSDSNANAWQIQQQYEDPIGRMAADERLVVHVQEVDRMRPSDYPNEPVDPQMFETKVYDPANIEDYLVETGPRFAGNAVVAGQTLVCDDDLR